MKNLFSPKTLLYVIIAGLMIGFAWISCKPTNPQGGMTSITDDAASKVYVAPGQKDEFYLFASGGFSGQVGIYGIPSGRLLKVIPVFSQNAENGYGYSEETIPMLETSYGFVPWDDSHHPELSQTDAEVDGKYLFINGNNTPRIARIDLTSFKTTEIIEVPNTGGNHSSPFITPNTEYVVAGTRFSIPVGENTDVPISTYKENFRGAITYIRADDPGNMKVAFQIMVPGFNYDLSHAGKGPSMGWQFFTSYNTEQANSLLEVNASQKDKDYILCVNWKLAEQLIADGKGKTVKASHTHNVYDEHTHTANSETLTDVVTLEGNEHPGLLYYIPCPKSPHGVDVDPTGRFIVASGKLAAVLPVYSFEKIQSAITAKDFAGDEDGIPVIKYESALAGEVQKPGLGPLHTEFDNNGNAYTSMFVSSEIVKWNVETREVLDRVPTYYSIGHLSIPGGDSKKPWGKYVVALNKITKDRYLPTGPELTQSAQLYDITGNKMELLLDFPTIGEPHYAQMATADLVTQNQIRVYKIEENEHPYVAKGEKEARVERNGNEVHIYMTSIRSHFAPDNIEGVKLGDEVYFHVTNLEQDWDVPHGFAIKGANNAELLIMPGETATLKWVPDRVGVEPFYCSDFCSALHQEMQGYIRVSPANSNVALKWGLNKLEL